MTAQRLAPLTGVLAFLLLVAAIVVGGFDTPDSDAPAREVANYFDDSKQGISAVLVAYAAIFFLLFAGTLRSALQRADKGTGSLAAVALAGAVAIAIGMGIFAGIVFTLNDIAGKRIDPGALQALNALNEDLFFPLAIGAAVFYLSAGASIVRNGGLPKWLGWVTVVLGILALTPGGFLAFLALLPWMLVAAILLYLGAAPAAAGDGGGVVPRA